MAHIDSETSVMGSALKFPHETGGEMYWSSHHPDTATPIKGQAIPDWTAVQERLLRLVASYPFFRHVGWDVIVAQGEAWLIEGNHNPSPVAQVFKPYLKDPQIGAFSAITASFSAGLTHLEDFQRASNCMTFIPKLVYRSLA